MSDSNDLVELEAALKDHGLQVAPPLRSAVCSFARQLWAWNEKLNLTRHTTWDLFVGRDVRDTLELSAWINPGEEVLDVGSGGGVPGLLLSILRSDVEVTVSDSMAKKAKVLGEITKALKLIVAVHHARAEDVLEDLRFHSVIARAVGPMWKLCTWFEPHWASVGRLLLVKGPNWPAERGEARHRGLMANLELRCLNSYATPGADGESAILQLWPAGREQA